VASEAARSEPGTACDPGQVGAALRVGRHRFIYVTHNETSTGVLSPLAPLGELARQFDALLLVDAVSSLGGVVIDMDQVGADVVAGASQKCLELPPGLAPLAVGPRAWQYLRAMKQRRVPYVLDLLMWDWSLQARGAVHPTLTTAATTLLYALDWMVDQIRAEGLPARQERFRAAGQRLMAGLRPLGFSAPVDARWASPVMTVVQLPAGMSAPQFRDYCLRQHNLMIGAGSPTTVRVAHFGQAAGPERIDLLIQIAAQFVAAQRR